MNCHEVGTSRVEKRTGEAGVVNLGRTEVGEVSQIWEPLRNTEIAMVTRQKGMKAKLRANGRNLVIITQHPEYNIPGISTTHHPPGTGYW